MIKFLLPLLALLFAVLSLLTWVRAPDYMLAWKLAILADEYGHWLVILVVVLAALNGLRAPSGGRTLTLALCVVAGAGLLRPTFSARLVAEKLPAEITTAFGESAATEAPLEFSRLYGRGVTKEKITMTTEVFARPEGQELKLDFYAPLRREEEKSSDPGPRRGAPCLVVIHGGGWDGGDRTQLADWNPRWAARGYAVAAIDYRLAPHSIWPAQRQDVLAAIAWLKDHATQLGIDPACLVLLGRSAGGQIATAVGYGARDPAIRGVIALYAPHDMPFVWSVSREDDALNSVKLMKQYMGGPPTEANRADYLSASGQWLARSDSPPTLLVHGQLDTLSWDRHSERLDARLAELGVKHFYLRLPWATHGFDFNPDGPSGQLTDYAIDRFLATVTK
ncbi:MAG: alpha/beta hydrolase [Opitutaceae bacterium]